jgi:hypothetical protein
MAALFGVLIELHVEHDRHACGLECLDLVQDLFWRLVQEPCLIE